MRRFKNYTHLTSLIDGYFKFIEGECHYEPKQTQTDNGKTSKKEKKIWDRLPEPPTLTGLALFLGFKTMDEYELYEQKGRCKYGLKQARLRIIAEYEKKLHQPSAYGAIFALKTMGWNEKPVAKTDEQSESPLKVEIIETGVKPAHSEKEVNL